jgi:D-beta-D-heptose 7-phosphate kinase/D-beta-D-heptose 1-phosphate adenosyltransferase
MINKFLKYNRQHRPKIAILGDIMIDEYYEVKVNRKSPEAPILVMVSQSDEPTKVVLGGASNVAVQLKNFNVDVTLFGIVDEEVVKICKDQDINLSYILGRPVPRKKRFYDTQALMRWDVEDNCEYSYENQLKPLLKLFAKEKYDILVISDYDKGICQHKFIRELITLCNLKGTKTIVDPKKDILKWKGCTILKPNDVEAVNFIGSKDPAIIRNEVQCDSVCITQEDGVITCDGNETETYYEEPIKKTTAIFGFSGAGDCFVATLSLAIAHNFKLAEAVKIAYKAGKIYVQSDHNKPIYPLDLYENKFVNPEDLRNRDFKLVMTNGVFDCGLTSSHVNYLKQSKFLGDKLVVALNSDESVRMIKGEDRPIMNLEERMQIIGSLEDVDFVVYFEQNNPLELIKIIKPDIVCKGGDYKKEDIVGYGIVDVVVLDKFNTISTTKKLEKIRKIWNDD